MNQRLVKPFIDAVESRSCQTNADAFAGEACIGYFCPLTPVEIIHAAGFTPVRITGDPGTVEKAYAHVPDFICPYMKRALEKALEGRYRFLKGIVQAYTCDAACGMVNIWQENIGGGIYQSLPLPYNDSRDSRSFMQSEFQRLAEALAAAGGAPAEDRLERSMAIYGRIRRHLKSLHDRMHAGKSPFSARDMFYVHAAGNLLAPESYLHLLDALAPQMAEDGPRGIPGCPVLVSGSILESPEVLAAIESAGGRVVADDLCSGYRQLVPIDGQGADPMERLVDRYMKRARCPARTRAENRCRDIAGLTAQSGARGVILIVQKFCTPHLSDYPILAAELKTYGYPVIMVEVDETWQAGGQLATRFAGFFEMLEAGDDRIL